MKPKISEAELEVMKIVWESYPITANQIFEQLKKNTYWEEPTVRTLINRLTQKNYLIKEKKNVYYYSPAIPESQYIKEQTKTFLNKVYGGKAKNLVASLFEDDYLTNEDFQELKNFWDKEAKKDE